MSRADNDQGEFELIHYETPDCAAEFSLDAVNETVWANQAQIAQLFGVTAKTVNEHIGNIFREGELEEDSVIRKFRITAADGKDYNTLHYNLDMILSVGYRVSSAKATAFRRWASQTLKAYLVQGFAINEARLKDDPRALRELAAKVRALRSDEKNIYAVVRDVFAFSSIDYDSNSKAAQSFFAKLTDKFLYAVTGKPAAALILDRADHKLRNMGLQSMRGDRPNHADVSIGKNYLFEHELYNLHIICEQFLLFVESKAVRGKQMTMNELSDGFDELLKVQGHQIFSAYGPYIVQRAKTHAAQELELYRARMMLLPPEQRDSAVMSALKKVG